MRRPLTLVALLAALPVSLLAALLLGARPARACGNVAHAWISVDAVERLPPGPLRALLERPDLRRHLRSGTLFPDGGYAVGDDYGERAHWEPFQDRYLAWIRAHGGELTGEELAPHVAFLMGMASHGLADQAYDAVFMEASKEADPGWHDGCDGLTCGFDSVTDFLWAHLNGPQEAPERWLPEELFPRLYREAGHEVSVETMRRGSDQVGSGIFLVSAAGRDASLVATHEGRFPWAFAHMDLPARGAPRSIAPMVAAYWQVLWARLQGGGWQERPVLATLPADGDFAHPREAGRTASRLSIVFARGLSQRALDPALFTLADAKGTALPITTDLFYRDASHVVNVQPGAALAVDETYTLTVAAGVEAFDGTRSTAPFSFTFHTGPEPAPEPAEGCGCAAAEAGTMLALGLLLRRRRRCARYSASTASRYSPGRRPEVLPS